MDKITIKYKELTHPACVQTLNKVATTPTTAPKANFIRRLLKEIEKVRDTISKEYTEEIMNVYAQKNDKGEVIKPENSMEHFLPVEDKVEDMVKAEKAFGEKEAIIAWRPLSPSILSDMKMSASEQDALKTLFTDDEGPGIPGGFTGPQLVPPQMNM